MKYMLDTDICIYAIKHKPENVFINLEKHNFTDICISSITYGELMYGVEKSKYIDKNKMALVLFLANIEIVDFDSVAAKYYGEIRANLEKNGVPIGSLDMMIASHAMSLGCTLVSNNIKEYKRIQNLKLENWVR